MPLTESPDNTVILSSTDPPIVDALGNVYRLSSGENSFVILNGQEFPPKVAKALAYCGRHVWYQDPGGNWRGRRYPADEWGPPTRKSPLPIDLLRCIEEKIEEIEREQTIIIDNEVAQSKDIHTLMQSIGEIQVAIVMLVTTMKDILAAVSKNMPTKIVLDVAGASISSQPVPERPGP